MYRMYHNDVSCTVAWDKKNGAGTGEKKATFRDEKGKTRAHGFRVRHKNLYFRHKFKLYIGTLSTWWGEGMPSYFRALVPPFPQAFFPGGPCPTPRAPSRRYATDCVDVS